MKYSNRTTIFGWLGAFLLLSLLSLLPMPSVVLVLLLLYFYQCTLFNFSVCLCRWLTGHEFLLLFVCICISTTTTYALTLQHSFSAHRKFYKILVELALRWFILFVCFYFYFAAVFVRVFVAAAAAAVMYTHSWELIVCWRCDCKMAWIKLSLCTVRRF